MDVEVLEEVEAEQALNRAFRRKIMADHFKIFDFVAKGPELRDSDYGHQNGPASRCYLNFPQGAQRRINADTQDRLVGEHSVTCAGINGQFKIHGESLIFNAGPAEQYSFAMVKAEFSHQLKGGCVALRKGVGGILYQHGLTAAQRKKPAVYFISMRAMKEKAAGDGCSGEFINLIHLNQQPLAVETFFDGLNFFSFHTLCLKCKVNTEASHSQGKYRVTAYDAALVLQNDPRATVEKADVDGDLVVDALDAALIAQKAAGLL